MPTKYIKRFAQEKVFCYCNLIVQSMNNYMLQVGELEKVKHVEAKTFIMKRNICNQLLKFVKTIDKQAGKDLERNQKENAEIIDEAWKTQVENE